MCGKWLLAQRFLGTEISQREFEEASKRAKEKLQNIIKRFGDEGGKRLEAKYEAQIIAEEVKQRRMHEFTVDATEAICDGDFA